MRLLPSGVCESAASEADTDHVNEHEGEGKAEHSQGEAFPRFGVFGVVDIKV